MHVRIRRFDQNTSTDTDFIVCIRKNATIKELQREIAKHLSVTTTDQQPQQQLYFKGKQLNSEHTILDYGIEYDNVIQLMLIVNDNKTISDSSRETLVVDDAGSIDIKTTSVDCQFYQKGDAVDVRDDNNGAWFEAKIIDIYTKSRTNDNDCLFYQVILEGKRNAGDTFEVDFDDIRPRSYHIYDNPTSDVKPGMVVLANYNIDSPKCRGFWYDVKITTTISNSNIIRGTVLVGRIDGTSINDCRLKFPNEIMRIEHPDNKLSRIKHPTIIPFRKLPPSCDSCKDIPTRKCRDCGCQVCLNKTNAATIILCDECDSGYHLTCLDPPLNHVPSDDWYCPNCKTDTNEIVKAGEKLKLTSTTDNKINNDWGKGMACVGRTKECRIVAVDHYGAIPGIEVGTCWKFRIQVYEAGVHRHHIFGIHGRENDGAYSLILSGGYEDDQDDGDEVYYTGSGGRNLGNRRVGVAQTSDQQLTRMNRALALNCNAEFNAETGAEATETNWQAGKPVRVIRNYKLRKYSKFAPLAGNRYDGIYKVVKYFPKKGKSGFIVWCYLLRRDDPNPAPWTPQGNEFEIIYPSGYLEAQKVKNGTTISKKRKATDKTGAEHHLAKKNTKILEFQIDSDILSLISFDTDNSRVWNECIATAKYGKQKFIDKIEELFMCVCCHEIVTNPVTTICQHNICKLCLEKSFSVAMHKCPCCRFELGTSFKMTVNTNLTQILQLLLFH